MICLLFGGESAPLFAEHLSNSLLKNGIEPFFLSQLSELETAIEINESQSSIATSVGGKSDICGVIFLNSIDTPDCLSANDGHFVANETYAYMVAATQLFDCPVISGPRAPLKATLLSIPHSARIAIADSTSAEIAPYMFSSDCLEATSSQISHSFPVKLSRHLLAKFLGSKCLWFEVLDDKQITFLSEDHVPAECKKVAAQAKDHFDEWYLDVTLETDGERVLLRNLSNQIDKRTFGEYAEIILGTLAEELSTVDRINLYE